MLARIISTLVFVLCLLVMLPYVGYSDAMSSFAPRRSGGSGIFYISLLLPFILIWVPHKAALVIGGLVLLPALVISLIFLAIVLALGAPLILMSMALPLVLIVVTWYFCAFLIWYQSKG